MEGAQKGMSLAEAKQCLRGKVQAGAPCPCCGQFAKIYTRKLSHGMVMVLYKTWRAQDSAEDGWVHINTRVKTASRDYSYLRFWGLVIEKAIEPKDGKKGKDTKNSGYWRLTDKGVKFLNREIQVQSHIRLYDNRHLGMEGEMVDVSKCLRKYFSYEELMRS